MGELEKKEVGTGEKEDSGNDQTLNKGGGEKK